MAGIRRVLRCVRCGTVLQTTSPKKVGFISAEELKASGKEDAISCRTCYEAVKALNFSTLENDEADKKIIQVLKSARASDSVIIWAVDLFSFNGTLNPEVVRIVKGLKVVVFGTRKELFPKANVSTFERFLKERFEEVGIVPAYIRVISNPLSIPGEEMLKHIDEIRQGHDVFMIGNASANKSAIVDTLLKSYVNKTKKEIRHVNFPKTSLKVLEVPFTNSSSFYELPDLSQKTSMLGKLEASTLKFVSPKKEVKVSHRTLSVGESLMVGSLAAFSLEKAKSPLPMKVYAAEGVEFKKVKEKNLSDEIDENNKKKSHRPVSDRFSTFADYDLFEYEMENDGLSHDISISGLVWISFVGKGQVIRILLPKGVALKETLSKIR